MLRNFGEGNGVGRTEGGADSVENRSCVVVLKRPLEAVGV